jgi:hypothetical protein
MATMIERSERFLLRVGIRHPTDVGMAQRHARLLAQLEGFGAGARDALVSSIGDVAGEIVALGGEGEILLGLTRENGRHGIVVMMRVPGPRGAIVRMKKWLSREVAGHA